MKKFVILIFCTILSISAFAGKVKVVEPASAETTSRIEVVNDSTIIYHNVYGIQVAQPKDVYTGIFEYNPLSKKPMKLVIMNSGAYIWKNEDGALGTYILYASKSFDQVILRMKENAE